MSKGGGGQNTTSTTQVEKLPAELVPFYKDMLGRGVYESLTGYETYPSRRIADFDPYEAGAQEAYAEMAVAGTPQSLREAQAGIREIAGGSPYQRAAQADEVTESMLADVARYGQQRPEFTDVQSSDPRFTDTATQENYLLDGKDLAQGTFAKDNYLLGEDDLTQNALTQDAITLDKFRDAGILESYMNPYQQQFTDSQKRLAREESARASNEIGAQAAMAGGLGGYREGIMQSERERNLGTQLGDIQSRGDMENYMQARQAFDADRASDFNRQESNRQANLQFGEANRQADLQFGEANRQAGFQDMNQARQAYDRDRQANLQFGEADRQAGFQDIGQARQAYEQDRQANMQRADFNRQGLLQEADLSMQGYQTLGQDVDRRMSAASNMAGLTGTRQAMEYDRLGQLEAAGSRRRGLAQQGLDMGYQDFIRQQSFPREQLNLYSGLLRGVPVGPGTYQATYGNQPSPFQQLAGAGLGAAGLYGATQGGTGGWGSGWGG